MTGDRRSKCVLPRVTLLPRAVTVLVALCLLTGCNQPKLQAALTPLPYADDFSAPKSGWETLSDVTADVKYDAGALRITVKAENLTQWSVPSKLFKDATFEVDTKPVGGPKDNGYGVMFRVKDRKNFYHFEISSDGFWRAGIVQDGKWTNWGDWAQHPAIKAGDDTNYLNIPNHIKVVMNGDQLAYFVNDQQVFAREDKTFSQGDIGLLALTGIGATGTDVIFSKVRVSDLPAK